MRSPYCSDIFRNNYSCTRYSINVKYLYQEKYFTNESLVNIKVKNNNGVDLNTM